MSNFNWSCAYAPSPLPRSVAQMNHKSMFSFFFFTGQGGAGPQYTDTCERENRLCMQGGEWYYLPIIKEYCQQLMKAKYLHWCYFCVPMNLFEQTKKCAYVWRSWSLVSSLDAPWCTWLVVPATKLKPPIWIQVSQSEFLYSGMDQPDR